MSRNLIVFDIGIPVFKNNRILISDYASRFPGASVFPLLHNLARKAGWDMMTADVFISQCPDFSRAVCISNETTQMLPKLIRAGVEPNVLTSGESPNVAWQFYHSFKKLSSLFKHSYIFRGFSSRAAPTTVFHPYYWPNASSSMLEGPSWSERELVGMVTSCKARFSFNRQRIASRFMLIPRWLRICFYQLVDPALRFPDLYTLRLSAIEKFASEPQFHLFGKGWTEALKNWPQIRRIPFCNVPVSCDDKMEILSHFRFALCFENCVYPGYVTEKILDAFFAGAVPIYMGAPDITDYVPANCFIDYRRYASLGELWNELERMNERKWHDYRNAISSFLASPAFTPFKQETVAANFFRWLTFP